MKYTHMTIDMNCTHEGCISRSKYLVDIDKRSDKIEVHTLCRKHLQKLKTDGKTEIDACSKLEILPLSNEYGGQKDIEFYSDCKSCNPNNNDRKEKKVVRFEDTFDATCTETRCNKHLEFLHNRDFYSVITEHELTDISISAKDLS